MLKLSKNCNVIVAQMLASLAFSLRSKSKKSSILDLMSPEMGVEISPPIHIFSHQIHLVRYLQKRYKVNN